MKKTEATSFMCNAIIMLENLEELQDSLLWSKQVKYYGNKFVEEFSKKVLLIESELAKNDEEYKLVQDIQVYYEYIIKRIAHMDIENLAKLKSIITQLEEGTIIQASPEQIERMQNEEG